MNDIELLIGNVNGSKRSNKIQAIDNNLSCMVIGQCSE